MTNESPAQEWLARQEQHHLARIAYQAYGDSTEWVNYQGLPMPAWDQLPPKIREAWRAAASAAAVAHVGPTSG